MNADGYTKIVLSLIAIALCLSAAQDLGWIGASGSGGFRDGAKYRIVSVSQGRRVFLLNTHSGESWHADIRGLKSWIPIPAATPEEIAKMHEEIDHGTAVREGRRAPGKPPE